MTGIMQVQDYQYLKQDLSLPRLSSYQHFFKPESPIELYGHYCWNEAISAAFFRLIGIVEITLRNKLHSALRLTTPYPITHFAPSDLHTSSFHNKY